MEATTPVGAARVRTRPLARKNTLIICFLWLVLLSVTCDAVSQRVLQESNNTRGEFCVTVLKKAEGSATMTAVEQTLWYSSAAVTIEMYVRAFLMDEFIALAKSFRFNKTELSLGHHYISYYYRQQGNQVHTLQVMFDDVAKEPQPAKAEYHATNSNFENIRISAKGPLLFQWDSTCPESTTTASPPASTSPSSIPVKASITPSTKASISPVASTSSTRTTTTTTTATPLTTAVHQYQNTSNPDDSIINTQKSSSSEELDEETGKFWLIVWSVSAAITVVVILGLILLWIIRVKQRTYHDRLKRKTEAERRKQSTMQSAKRQSYLEQLRWAESNVDGNETTSYTTRLYTFS